MRATTPAFRQACFRITRKQLIIPTTTPCSDTVQMIHSANRKRAEFNSVHQLISRRTITASLPELATDEECEMSILRL
ncbi:hypothetical protein CEXT_12781 [Caerostris extrusa]|uniref:Uncharacterized protein n=1 Tax=Caerostris extrusa TaxID=172846 RepID=A0AAV4YA19_CAEEX|nr:hypothetical protein CEXT_12781 [Caerostris extrusa]